MQGLAKRRQHATQSIKQLETEGEAMSAITQIKAVIHTGDRNDAGTNGSVYLGICGREFKLGRADTNDFERSSHREYFFGNGSNVEEAKFNDPRDPLSLTQRIRIATRCTFVSNRMVILRLGISTGLK